MSWIPRSLNDKADYISRIQDFDDWKISPALFAMVDAMWGPHAVDCFAHVDNAQLPTFYSRFWCPGSAAVDAFTVSWADQINWWVPPVHLVVRTLRHAEACKATGTLVVPAWKSASFWPLLCPDGCHLAPFVHQCIFMPFEPYMFISSKSGNNTGDALTSDSVIMCLWLDFSAPPRSYDIGFCTKAFSGSCEQCTF